MKRFTQYIKEMTQTQWEGALSPSDLRWVEAWAEGGMVEASVTPPATVIKALKLAAYVGTVYRGISLAELSDYEHPQEQGKHFTLAELTSASKSREVALQFARDNHGISTALPLLMEITLRKQAGIDIASIVPSQWQYQKEVLLLAGTTFEVRAFTERNIYVTKLVQV